MKKSILKSTASIFACCFVFITAGHAQFNINEPLKTNTINSSILLGGAAHLTSGVSDPQGQGWLRLTDTTNFQAGYAVIQQNFPSAMGVLIDFEYTTWSTPGSNSGADGMSVFLFDANAASNFNIGGDGGSLGYAPRGSAPGLSGGYFGVGLDEFGNFSNPTEGRTGGPGMYKNRVSLRGPAPNYAYISGNQVIAADTGAGDNGGIDYNSTIAARPTAAQFYRRIQITLEPNQGTYTVTVKWKKGQNAPFTTLFGPVTMTELPPANLRLGFAASTGANHNFHEVRNMIITTPGNISVTKQGPAYITYSANPVNLSYDVTIKNQTPVTVGAINIADQLPAGYSVNPSTGITIEQYGNSANTVSNLSVNNGVLSGQASLAPNSELTLHVNGVMSNLHLGQTFRNTVKISTQTIQDTDTTNNVDTVYTTVNAPLPVKLTYFTAQKQQNDVILNWQTAVEINSDRFEIERSVDGKSFEAIATVKSTNRSSEPTTYQYLDNKVAGITASIAYYRLRQVDKDGKSDFSMIRPVLLSHDKNALDIKVYPVPFNNVLNIQVNAPKAGSVLINLYNTSGQRVYQTEYKVEAGLNETNLSQLKDLPAGSYMLECVQDGNSNKVKVIKY